MPIFNEKQARNPELYLQLENFTFLSKLYFSLHQSEESFIYFTSYRIKTLLDGLVDKYGIYFTLIDLLAHLAFSSVSLKVTSGKINAIFTSKPFNKLRYCCPSSRFTRTKIKNFLISKNKTEIFIWSKIHAITEYHFSTSLQHRFCIFICFCNFLLISLWMHYLYILTQITFYLTKLLLPTRMFFRLNFVLKKDNRVHKTIILTGNDVS